MKSLQQTWDLETQQQEGSTLSGRIFTKSESKQSNFNLDNFHGQTLKHINFNDMSIEKFGDNGQLLVNPITGSGPQNRPIGGDIIR